MISITASIIQKFLKRIAEFKRINYTPFLKKWVTFIIILLFILPVYSLAQKGCIDTFENKSWYHPQFKYLLSFYPPILYNDSSVLYNADGVLIKKNKQESILWTKKLFSGNSFQYAIPEFINSKEQTILSFAKGSLPTEQGLIKLGIDGNLIWSKRLAFNIQFGTLKPSVTKGPDNNIILGYHTGSNGVQFTITNQFM